MKLYKIWLTTKTEITNRGFVIVETTDGPDELKERINTCQDLKQKLIEQFESGLDARSYGLSEETELKVDLLYPILNDNA